MVEIEIICDIHEGNIPPYEGGRLCCEGCYDEVIRDLLTAEHKLTEALEKIAELGGKLHDDI